MDWRLHRYVPNREWLTFFALRYVVNTVVGHVPSHLFRLAVYRHVMRFTIGERSTICMGARFDVIGNLTVGRSSVVNRGCRLDTRGGIFIADNVSISEEVCILTADHDPHDPRFPGRNRPVRIEEFVFVGTRAMILPGVTIGRGAVVAAGAVVTKDVPPLEIVGGCPAKRIGSRPDQFDYHAYYRPLFS